MMHARRKNFFFVFNQRLGLSRSLDVLELIDRAQILDRCQGAMERHAIKQVDRAHGIALPHRVVACL